MYWKFGADISIRLEDIEEKREGASKYSPPRVNRVLKHTPCGVEKWETMTSLKRDYPTFTLVLSWDSQVGGHVQKPPTILVAIPAASCLEINLVTIIEK